MPSIQWSIVLATLVAIIGVVAALPVIASTPWGPFLNSLGLFINAIATLLIALGVITLAKKLKVKL
jgi:hypothetical protein